MQRHIRRHYTGRLRPMKPGATIIVPDCCWPNVPTPLRVTRSRNTLEHYCVMMRTSVDTHCSSVGVVYQCTDPLVEMSRYFMYKFGLCIVKKCDVQSNHEKWSFIIEQQHWGFMQLRSVMNANTDAAEFLNI